MELSVIQNRIHEVRGIKVMLDFDLAELYDVQTKVLNQAVKRNIGRFPADFMFRLDRKEWDFLRSQIVTLEKGKGKFPKYLPFVFTEHGVTMAASILHSEKAVKMNLAIVRAFIALRKLAFTYQELAQRLQYLEEKYDKQFGDVYEALTLLMAKKKRDRLAKRQRIGFRPKDQ